MPKKIKTDSNSKSSKRLPAWKKYFLLLAIMAVAGNGAAGYFSYKYWIVEKEQQQMLVLSTQYAQQQSQVVKRYLDDLYQSIRLIINTDSLATSLSDKNTSAIEEFESDIKNSLTASSWVRIYSTGRAELTPDAEQPIRFAELDMINRAEKREAAFPEASKIGDAWRIALVQPLPHTNSAEPEPAEGVLFLALPADELISALGQSNVNNGSTQLIQKFSTSQPQIIAQLGEQGVGEGAEIAIPQTHWRIQFNPTSALAKQAKVNPIFLLLALAILLVASVATAYVLAKWLESKLSRDHLSGAAGQVNSEVDKVTIGKTSPRKQDLIKAVKVRKEDTGLLGLDKQQPKPDPLDIEDTPTSTTAAIDSAPAHIFRAYDIRGIAETELSPSLVVAIGQAVATLALAAGDKSIYVARDGRTHSPQFAELLIEGLVSTGCNVINLGAVPTPLLNFAIYEDKQSGSGVMVTASHNPADYNGFKIVIDGKPIFDDSIQALRAQITQNNFTSSGTGREQDHDITAPYIDRIFSDVALAGELTVVIDAGNGITGKIAPRLLEELGCRVIPLYCDVDGTFPNHAPDPTVDSNLSSLVAKVKAENADLGIALDGDGDRLGIVTADGNIIRADRILMLLAKDIVSRNPGSDVVFDVKSSRELNNVVTTYGGRPIMWKSGHSPMRAKMLETNAVVGGELSGHIFIKERWYGFDDGLYAAVRILEIMSLRDQSLEEVLAGLPNPLATPEILIPIDESKKFDFIKALIEQAEFVEGRITTIDGLRVEFEKGWGLVRASNTSAALTLRFEGDSNEVLHDIQQQFKYQMLKVDSDLIIAFD